MRVSCCNRRLMSCCNPRCSRSVPSCCIGTSSPAFQCCIPLLRGLRGIESLHTCPVPRRLEAPDRLVPFHLNGQDPSYLVAGGLLFDVLSGACVRGCCPPRPLARAWQHGGARGKVASYACAVCRAAPRAPPSEPAPPRPHACSALPVFRVWRGVPKGGAGAAAGPVPPRSEELVRRAGGGQCS